MTREKGATIPKRLVNCAVCGEAHEVPMFYEWYQANGCKSPDIYICDIHHFHARSIAK